MIAHTYPQSQNEQFLHNQREEKNKGEKGK